MDADYKKYYEIELAVFFFDDGRVFFANVELLEEGEAKRAVEDNIFAEVNIPYHTDEAIYCFTCHIFNKPNHIPAIPEIVVLKQIAPWLHNKFKSECKEVSL